MPSDASTQSAGPFSIAVESRPDAVQIAPKGEVDLATVEQVQRQIGQAIAAGTPRIVIDLRGVEFLDSTGLHMLMAANAQAQDEQRELSIIPGTRTVQRIFEITGLIDLLPFATPNGSAPYPVSADPVSRSAHGA